MFSEKTTKKTLPFSMMVLMMLLLAAGGVLFPQIPIQAADVSFSNPEDSSSAGREDPRMRGIWLSYEEYAPLGLSVFDSEEAYRENADRFLAAAWKYRINTVFLHARAFDDAFWRSKTFLASKYVGGDESLTAAEAYEKFDPFGVFLEEAHKYGIAVHAWLNPYRVTFDYFYDPGDDASTERLLTAVRELLAYESNGEKIDGIHIDDYFYHARKGYFRVGNTADTYAIAGSESERPAGGSSIVVPPAEKRANVNKMVRAVYDAVSEAGRTFGISPEGNYENDMNAGADIDTWLSEEGYLDYIIPQIYWSNQWGTGNEANTTMYTNRLDQFLGKRKNNAKFYVGLALYRTEAAHASGDPGWQRKTTNLAEQIAELESKGADGYACFSAQYLFRSCAAGELDNIKNTLNNTVR